MQSVEIYLFRHGETDWNVQERFQGHIDIPLNDFGREQARQLVPTLKQSSIQAILSSDLSRALETAQIVAKDLQVPIFQDMGLREAYLGEAQGLTRIEMKETFGEELTMRWASSKISDADACYPGGETGKQVLLRAFAALENFILTQQWSRIGVATHGGVIRRIMHRLLPPDSPPVPIPNGVIYPIQYDQKNKAFFIPMS